jgi:mono/diheme cytochrome c family protein
MKNRIWPGLLISAAVGVTLAQTAVLSRHSRSPLERAGAVSRSEPNPYQGNREAERAGAKLFRRYCAACHGEDARGNGKAPPLVSPEVGGAMPGALFWVLRNGSLASGMPSFSRLPEAQRWQIIAWLQRLNAAGSATASPPENAGALRSRGPEHAP